MLLNDLRTPEGDPIPPNTLDEIKRDMERRQLICEQIRRIEQERVQRLEQAPDTGPNAMVHLLARVTGIGIETADTLVREVLTRNLRDRRAVARYGGLTGAPNQSGSFSRERGLARSGNPRVRRCMIELAWRFVRLQKDSPLVKWFELRTANTCVCTENSDSDVLVVQPTDKRMRRNVSGALNRSGYRGIFVQGTMGPRLIVIASV